jgi:hypothetical protein
MSKLWRKVCRILMVSSGFFLDRLKVSFKAVQQQGIYMPHLVELPLSSTSSDSIPRPFQEGAESTSIHTPLRPICWALLRYELVKEAL